MEKDNDFKLGNIKYVKVEITKFSYGNTHVDFEKILLTK